MEIRSCSCVNLERLTRPGSGSGGKRTRLKWFSLPNLHSSQFGSCGCCPPGRASGVGESKSSTGVIPGLLQKTWNKIKSMNKKRSSAPPTPNSLQKFDFEDERVINGIICSEKGEGEEDVNAVHENYMKLQRRLSEELHQGQIQQMVGKTVRVGSGVPVWEAGGKGGGGGGSECGEFKRKLQQWEMWKASCGKVTFTDEELRLILPEDFSRKLKEWESIRSGSPCAVTNAKIEKQIQWLERQLEKVEQEKGKLELQMRKYLEKEARLEKMREALKNYPREQVLIKTATAEGIAAGADEKFTKKLYEWEEMRGIPAEDGSMALLNPKYYHQLGGSSTSSEQLESEDVRETSVDEPEPNTPDTSSSLESINQASGSNTSSADFYGKCRRRSSDAVSTPLSARSPSLSAFTSDDEDNTGLLKTVEEEENEERGEGLPPNPVVRVNQIVVEEEEDEDDDDDDGQGESFKNVIVATKRTLIKPIDGDGGVKAIKYVPPAVIPPTTTPTPPLSISVGGGGDGGGPDLRSPGLVRSIALQSSSNCFTRSSSSGENSSLGSPTKLHVEDIWNKNIDGSPPPIRDGPKVVGFIPKLPPLPPTCSGNSAQGVSSQLPQLPASSPPSFPLSNNYPGYSGCYVQKPVFQHDGLRNFPKMGKTPVWVSPLVARRKMNLNPSNQGHDNRMKEGLFESESSEFSLDRFLQNRNLGSMLSSSGSGSKYTIGGGFPPQQEGPVRLISLSRSSSFGRGGSRRSDVGSRMEPDFEAETEEVALAGRSENTGSESGVKVCKSKSASSLLKSSFNIFSKVRRSETLRVNTAEVTQPVKVTKAKWFLNRF